MKKTTVFVLCLTTSMAFAQSRVDTIVDQQIQIGNVSKQELIENVKTAIADLKAARDQLANLQSSYKAVSVGRIFISSASVLTTSAATLYGKGFLSQDTNLQGAIHGVESVAHIFMALASATEGGSQLKLQEGRANFNRSLNKFKENMSSKEDPQLTAAMQSLETEFAQLVDSEADLKSAKFVDATTRLMQISSTIYFCFSKLSSSQPSRGSAIGHIAVQVASIASIIATSGDYHQAGQAMDSVLSKLEELKAEIETPGKI